MLSLARSGPGKCFPRSRLFTFVDVLVKVLDRGNHSADLDVDVALVLEEEVGVVGDHPFVTVLHAINCHLVQVAAAKVGIAINVGTCGITKVLGSSGMDSRYLWKLLGTDTLTQAHRAWVKSSTLAVNHEVSDGSVQLWLFYGVGDLATANLIHIAIAFWLVLTL